MNGSEPGKRHAATKYVLSGIITCGTCGRQLVVTGRNAAYYHCTNRGVGICTNELWVRRDVAEQAVFQFITKDMIVKPAWTDSVFEEARKAWKSRMQTTPDEMTRLRNEVATVAGKIERLVDAIEDGQVDATVSGRLQSRREEERKLESRLAQLASEANTSCKDEPTKEWVVQQLIEVASLVQHVETDKARDAVSKLLGGSLIVRRGTHPRTGRKVPIGVVAKNFEAVAAGLLGAEAVAPVDADREAVEIRLYADDPRDEEAEKAKRLYDQGVLQSEIGTRMGWSRSKVTALLKWWCKKHDQQLPDGRRRRHQAKPAIKQHEKTADEVHELAEQGLPLQDIATRLNVGRDEITKALKHWYVSRGLTYEDGRARRKRLNAKKRRGR